MGADIQYDYDTVIIGAGPAGATLARRLATQKRNILLIDGSTQQGEKLCGGLLSPDAQDLLAAYDIAIPNHVLSSPQLFSVRVLDLAHPQTRHYRRSYMNVDRGKFDALLRSLVPDTVSVLSGVCRTVRRENGGFTLLVKTDGGEQTISCRYLVGADGAASVVRKCLFPHKRITRYVALQQQFPAGDENPYYSCIFDPKTSPSCSWIFFKDGRLVFGGAFEKKGCRTAFEAQKRKLITQGTVPEQVMAAPLETRACAVLRPGFFRGICHGKEGAYLIGEAAGFISPSSLEGISYALSSAEALYQAFSGAESDKRILRLYKSRSAGLFWKIKLKCLKRPFMYLPPLRALILKTGIGSMQIKRDSTANNPNKTFSGGSL